MGAIRENTRYHLGIVVSLGINTKEELQKIAEW